MVTSKDMGPRTESFGSMFVKNQFHTKIPIPTRKEADVGGKVAIVTGANSGLGLECCKQLLSLGLSRLIMAVRSLERGNAAAAALRQAHPKANIDVWSLDMESYQSVEDFVRQCESQLSQVDIVILNAGLFPAKFAKVASSGHEVAVQVNYLSTALLVLLLVPMLKQLKVKSKLSMSAPPHITVVTSVTATLAKIANRRARPFLASFDDPKFWDGTERYGSSKLLGQLFLVKLADCVKSSDVIINMVDPGAVKGTKLGSKMPAVLRAIGAALAAVVARPVSRGAATYIDAAVIKGQETHGSFLINCEIAP
jgi:NAD(P)-dependent dehydrogenase (short-subunit alcohol dehydrogenase family)